MSGRPGRSAEGDRATARDPGTDPGRAYLYSRPNLSPATSLQRPSSSASQRSAHFRPASQSSAGPAAVAAAPHDAGHRRNNLQQHSAEDQPPAALAAEAALAALSRIHISPSAPPSTTTSDAISDDISVSDHVAGGSGGGRGERVAGALGAIEDAKVALDVLARAIDDAVYLDEDAFAQALPAQAYTRTIEAQQRRIAELEARLEAAQRTLAQQGGATMAAQRRLGELQEELENNAVVFKLHYNELLAKDEEIARLRAVVQGLSGR